MSGYVLTEYSRDDLLEIRHYTCREWGNQQSTHYLEKLKKTLSLLSEMPFMGKACQDDLALDIYRLPFNNHMIYYSPISNNQVMIVAVLHQKMLPQKHIESRF